MRAEREPHWLRGASALPSSNAGFLQAAVWAYRRIGATVKVHAILTLIQSVSTVTQETSEKPSSDAATGFKCRKRRAAIQADMEPL